MGARYDTIVIGGGQAGLAMGWHLARRGRDFLILDAAPRVGDAWRSRWDSLTLFTPARYDALPGMAFPAEPDHLPGKDEAADYVERYAYVFGLPVRTGEPVLAVRRVADGSGFEVVSARATYHAGRVVVATGPFQKPALSRAAQRLAPDVVQLHSSAYRGPGALPSGPVLVVGGGNSGLQIAAELAQSRPTWLAVGTRLPRLPARVLGRSVFAWLEGSGAMRVSVDTALGRRMSARDFLIGGSLREVAARGVRLAGRVVDAHGSRVTTADGQDVEPAAVVWATGFAPDYRYLDLPVLDGAGRPVHRRGVTAVPGLYLLGLPWQHTRGSALLGWVGRDAAWLAERIAEEPRSAPPAPTRAPRTSVAPAA